MVVQIIIQALDSILAMAEILTRGPSQVILYWWKIDLEKLTKINWMIAKWAEINSPTMVDKATQTEYLLITLTMRVKIVTIFSRKSWIINREAPSKIISSRFLTIPDFLTVKMMIQCKCQEIISNKTLIQVMLITWICLTKIWAGIMMTTSRKHLIW